MAYLLIFCKMHYFVVVILTWRLYSRRIGQMRGGHVLASLEAKTEKKLYGLIQFLFLADLANSTVND